jgi:tripartite motif-containing protein 2/3
MPKLLRCPSCTAPLEPSAVRDGVLSCSFCGSTLALPYEGAAAPAAGRRGPFGVVAVLIVAVGLVVAGLAAVVVVSRSPAAAPAGPEGPRPVSTAAPPKSAPAASPLASPVLTFGSKGIGPGQFEDNRSVAVGPDGRIYVAEYSTGRLQVFDAAGAFLTQWPLEEDRVVLDVLADRRGSVLVSYPGHVAVHDAATGQVVRTVKDVWAEDLTLTPDNRVLAVRDGDVAEVDAAAGTSRMIHTGLLARARVKSSRVEGIAVDGLGNMYLAESIAAVVLKYDRNGEFLDRFGGKDDAAAGFSSPHGIAVDGQGRVWVSNIAGIRVYDPTGRVLGDVDLRQAFGIVLSDAGELYVAARPTVVKLHVE